MHKLSRVKNKDGSYTFYCNECVYRIVAKINYVGVIISDTIIHLGGSCADDMYHCYD